MTNDQKRDIEWLRNEVKENIDYMTEEGYPGVTSTLKDVLELMTPEEMDMEGGGSSWWYVCPECHGETDRWDRWCRHCGQALKAGVKA